MSRVDVLVLGAGIAGLSLARALLARGRSVLVVDREPPARQASFGNAGLVQASSVHPFAFPTYGPDVVAALTGWSSSARLDWGSLGGSLRPLLDYMRAGSAAGIARTRAGLAPLLTRAMEAHEEQARACGSWHLYRPRGWVEAFTSSALLCREQDLWGKLQAFGVKSHFLDGAQARALEPAFSDRVIGAIHLADNLSVSDPGAVVAAMAGDVVAKGGRISQLDANQLAPDPLGWRLASPQGEVIAGQLCVALGAWSGNFLRQLGVRVPMFTKRGYHVHCAPGGAHLHLPVVAPDWGFIAAPMQAGIRITTGAEFAAPDAPPNLRQVRRSLAGARVLLPGLGDVTGDPIWMGRRPCFPDLLPALGRVRGLEGVFVHTGHQHLGFTLSPVTAQLVADEMTGIAPAIDLSPYRLERFA